MDIVVPIDESDPAMQAVEHAVSEYPDARVTVIHVINPNIGMYGEGAVYAYDSLLEARQSAADTLFESAGELADEYDRSIETETVVGLPAREIVRFADEGAYDHIVMGSHGRSGASRVLLGSVAEQVVRRAPVPVTVVR